LATGIVCFTIFRKPKKCRRLLEKSSIYYYTFNLVNS